MKRRKVEKYTPPNYLEIHETFSDGKFTLNPGDTCKLKNETGTYKYIRFVVNKNIPNHEGWVDLYGGPLGYASYRSVKPDRIKVDPPKKRKAQ